MVVNHKDITKFQELRRIAMTTAEVEIEANLNLAINKADFEAVSAAWAQGVDILGAVLNSSGTY